MSQPPSETAVEVLPIAPFAPAVPSTQAPLGRGRATPGRTVPRHGSREPSAALLVLLLLPSCREPWERKRLVLRVRSKIGRALEGTLAKTGLAPFASRIHPRRQRPPPLIKDTNQRAGAPCPMLRIAPRPLSSGGKEQVHHLAFAGRHVPIEASGE